MCQEDEVNESLNAWKSVMSHLLSRARNVHNGMIMPCSELMHGSTPNRRRQVTNKHERTNRHDVMLMNVHEDCFETLRRAFDK
jgi:hypothetical protein